MKNLIKKYCRPIYFILTILILIQTLNAQDTNTCGTPANIIQSQLNNLTKTIPTLSGTASQIETQHFIIYYTLSGSDSTTLAWADSIAIYAETSWVRTERLGWVLPPPTST